MAVNGNLNTEKPKGKVNEYTGGDPIQEAREKAEKFRCGGSAKKRAKGGVSASGNAAMPRLDKRARGGVLSAAADVQGRPGGKYDGGTDKSND